jgi:hypothetical protein
VPNPTNYSSILKDSTGRALSSLAVCDCKPLGLYGNCSHLRGGEFNSSMNWRLGKLVVEQTSFLLVVLQNCIPQRSYKGILA